MLPHLCFFPPRDKLIIFSVAPDLLCPLTPGKLTLPALSVLPHGLAAVYACLPLCLIGPPRFNAMFFMDQNSRSSRHTIDVFSPFFLRLSVWKIRHFYLPPWLGSGLISLMDLPPRRLSSPPLLLSSHGKP